MRSINYSHDVLTLYVVLFGVKGHSKASVLPTGDCLMLQMFHLSVQINQYRIARFQNIAVKKFCSLKSIYGLSPH